LSRKIRVHQEHLAPDGHVAIDTVLARLEEARELRWAKREPAAVALKLRWRASVVQHLLGVLPGDQLLEFGAGSGLLTAELSRLLEVQSRVTAVSFSKELTDKMRKRRLPRVSVAANGLSSLPENHFDFAVGSGMLLHAQFAECLRRIFDCLKPGGRILFFEPNFRFPARLANELRFRDRTFTQPSVIEECARAGFSEVDLAPHDIVSSNLTLRWMTLLQGKAILLEHLPVIRTACASVRLMAMKPGVREKPPPDLASLPGLAEAVSVVIPARNEAANIPSLVSQLLAMYGRYIHEILIVNDGSTDETAAILDQLATGDSRVRAVHRSSPNGVGLALRDGYRFATGRYILSMDCDFAGILPQLVTLFKAVAEGRDGAIGSRFSHDSILVGYPFSKLLFNRLCHAVIKLFLVSTVRDITNNLKLYRAEIFKELNIRSQHFSANLETGLGPLLAGYDIVEVPISWVNRTKEMGASSFSLRHVGMAYTVTLRRYVCDSKLKGRRGILQNAVRNCSKWFRSRFVGRL
jgi:dolichol-phosphate mannosyltransferase